MNQKVLDYPRVNLTVIKPGDDEMMGESVFQGAQRKVLANVTLGPEPLIASVANYGGAGDKFQLLVYSKSPATIIPIGVGGDDGKCKAVFAHFDVNGDGGLSRDEVAKVLLELDLFTELDVDEQRELIDEEFAEAAEGADKIDFDKFLEWYHRLLE